MPTRSAPAVLLLFSVTGGLRSQEITLAIESVTVIDPTASTAQAARVPNQTVLIAGRRIARVGATGSIAAPAGATRIDGSGRFLVPGFWDMHVHFNRDEATNLLVMAPLMIAHGITSVRDMRGDCWEPCGFGERTLPQMRDLQRRIEAGEVVAPRLQALSSPLVHGPTVGSGYPNDFPQYWQPRDAEQGRAVTRFLADRGVDFIKGYNSIPRAAYFAMLDEAQQMGIGVSGHLPWGVHPIEAANAGVRTIEHARWPVMACNPEHEAFRAMNAATAAQQGEWDGEVFGRFRDAVTQQFDPARCEAIFAALAANDVYLVPTHLTREMDARAADSTYRNDPRRRYVPPTRLRAWDRDLTGTAGGPPELQAFYQGVFPLGLRVTGMAHEAGVKILVGTDAFDTMVFPGFSYHDELVHLSRAGLSPLAILHAATSGAAEFLGVSDRFGRVGAGQVADLVLLDADPLLDIRNASKIRTVIFNGNAYDRAHLDRLIRGVEEHVARLR